MSQQQLKSNMKRVELKRIVEFLWKGSPADEKTPFASQGTLPDNGSFSKNLEADDNKKAPKEFPEDEGENVEGPMSLSRKLCFAMSFNVWILYFLVLGWLLPCRHHDCGLPFPETMEKTLPNIWPLTDVEPMNGRGLPSLAMLGYSDGEEEKLAALATFDATMEWNNTLQFTPKKIQCNFENIFDANGDGIPDCLLSGADDVYAFNASNGYVFWHRNLPSEEIDFLSGFHPTSVHHGETYLIKTYRNKMVVLNARTGHKTSEIDLPCRSPFDFRLVSNPANSSLWSLVCDYGDEIEAWGFGERDVLKGGNSEDKANATDFALLFSGSNSGESIALRCDVTAVPGGPLLLSWSDRVAMVTRESTAWEHQVPYPLTVAGIAVGNFSLLENEVAAAVRNETDTIVFLLKLKDGSVINSVQLQNRQAISIEKVPGNKTLLLLKSIVLGNSTRPTYTFSDPIPPYDQTNFALIDFYSKPIKIKEIANATAILSSSLNKQTNGETDLLILDTTNGTVTYKKYVIHSSEERKSLCHGISEL